jgi:hypothetical protein
VFQLTWLESSAAGSGLTWNSCFFDSAGQSVDAVTKLQADIGFFAIDPLRGEAIAFTAAYILVEGAYLVRGLSARAVTRRSINQATESWWARGVHTTST